MPRTNTYVNREAKNGEFSCHIRKDVNVLLDIYCKFNGINKTAYVNALIEEKMGQVFNRLVEEVSNEQMDRTGKANC